MTLTITYGMLNGDDVICPTTRHTREAKKFEEEIDNETVVRYALPEGRDESDFTVTDLNQAEAEALAERLQLRAQSVHNEPWGWEVT